MNQRKVFLDRNWKDSLGFQAPPLYVTRHRDQGSAGAEPVGGGGEDEEEKETQVRRPF